jgi:hypothetical protein
LKLAKLVVLRLGIKIASTLVEGGRCIMGNIFANLQWKKKPGYILDEIKHPCNIGKVKKRFCKNAILWLLSKASHSVREIADHFDISPELVQCLIVELIAAKRVMKLPDSDRYQALKKSN